MRGQWSAALHNCAVRVSAEWKYDKSEVEGWWASLVSKLRLHTADSAWSTSPQTAVSPTPSVYLPLSLIHVFLSFCCLPFPCTPTPHIQTHSVFILIQMHRHTHMIHTPLNRWLSQITLSPTRHPGMKRIHAPHKQLDPSVNGHIWGLLDTDVSAGPRLASGVTATCWTARVI